MQQYHSSGCQTKGMVQPVDQRLGGLFPLPQAIRSGTLFPELSKPMNGECPEPGGTSICPEQAQAFAAWELRLYLDTHPDCEQALQWYRQLCAQNTSYACAFIPCNASGWRWVDDPWPWELAANERRG